MQPSVEDIQAIAIEAGKILMGGFGKTHQVHHKGLTDPVTEMDRASEEYILGQIQARFGDHAIFAEESGLTPGQQDHLWFVDPLDGTVNYLHSVPIFSVSIGYAFQGRLKMGVVYDPTRNECFSAQRGQGAWLNNQLITVSNTSQLIESLLVTGFPYDMHAAEPNNLQEYARFCLRAQAARRLGSAALDLCYVACGRLDGYWEVGIKPYDFAAGALVVREAGGIVTDWNEEPDLLAQARPFRLVASNGQIHTAMLEVIRNREQIL